MADRISAKIVTQPVLRDIRAQNREVDKATQKGLRAVGRRVAAAGRKRAPVYQGEARNISYGDGNSGPLVPGELKKSIKPSRRLTRHGRGDYSLKVGPRGGHVHLYAAKQEARDPFMQPAYDEAEGSAKSIYEAAWEKAMNK